MLCLWQKENCKTICKFAKFFGFQSEILIQLHQVMSVFFTFINRVQEADCEALKSSLVAGVTGWAGTPKNVFMEQGSIRKIWKIRNLLSLRNDQTEVTFRHRTELKYVSAFYDRWQLTTCWKELRGISWSNLQAVSDVTQLYFCYIEAIKRPL